jgi:hypothetical protein
MADLKISELVTATTPLVGTEVVPLVQSGTTKKVTVSNLTAGRDVAAKSVVVTSSLDVLATFTRTGVSGLDIRADSGGPILNPSTVNQIQIYNAAVAVRQFALNTSTGNLNLDKGNLVIGTSGKGIDFSATPGTGTNELLSDYEEGTWTPTLNSFVGGTLTAVGHYSKIGRVVYLTAYVTNTGSGFATTAGVSSITNLPFAPNTTISNFATVTNSNAATITSQNQAGIVNSGSSGIIYVPTFTNIGTEPESICCWYFV